MISPFYYSDLQKWLQLLTQGQDLFRSMSRNLVNYPEACRFFLQGRCNRGNNCRWSHEVSASPNETLAHLSTYGGSINYLEPLGIPVIEPTLPLRAAENNNPTRYERPPWQRNGRASSSAKGKGKAPVQSQETNSILENSSGVGYAAASAIASSGWHRPGPSRKRNDHENIITGHETVHMNTPLSFVQNMYSTVSHPVHNSVLSKFDLMKSRV